MAGYYRLEEFLGLGKDEDICCILGPEEVIRKIKRSARRVIRRKPFIAIVDLGFYASVKPGIEQEEIVVLRDEVVCDVDTVPEKVIEEIASKSRKILARTDLSIRSVIREKIYHYFCEKYGIMADQ